MGKTKKKKIKAPTAAQLQAERTRIALRPELLRQKYDDVIERSKEAVRRGLPGGGTAPRTAFEDPLAKRTVHALECRRAELFRADEREPLAFQSRWYSAAELKACTLEDEPSSSSGDESDEYDAEERGEDGEARAVRRLQEGRRFGRAMLRQLREDSRFTEMTEYAQCVFQTVHEPPCARDGTGPTFVRPPRPPSPPPVLVAATAAAKKGGAKKKSGGKQQKKKKKKAKAKGGEPVLVYPPRPPAPMPYWTLGVAPAKSNEQHGGLSGGKSDGENDDPNAVVEEQATAAAAAAADGPKLFQEEARFAGILLRLLQGIVRLAEEASIVEQPDYHKMLTEAPPVVHEKVKKAKKGKKGGSKKKGSSKKGGSKKDKPAAKPLVIPSTQEASRMRCDRRLKDVFEWYSKWLTRFKAAPAPAVERPPPPPPPPNISRLVSMPIAPFSDDTSEVQPWSLEKTAGFIAELLEEKIQADQTDDAAGNPRDSMKDFVFEYFEGMYGRGSELARVNLLRFALGCEVHASNKGRVHIFAALCGIVEAPKHVDPYGYCSHPRAYNFVLHQLLAVIVGDVEKLRETLGSNKGNTEKGAALSPWPKIEAAIRQACPEGGWMDEALLKSTLAALRATAITPKNWTQETKEMVDIDKVCRVVLSSWLQVHNDYETECREAEARTQQQAKALQAGQVESGSSHTGGAVGAGYTGTNVNHFRTMLKARRAMRRLQSARSWASTASKKGGFLGLVGAASLAHATAQQQEGGGGGGSGGGDDRKEQQQEEDEEEDTEENKGVGARTTVPLAWAALTHNGPSSMAQNKSEGTTAASVAHSLLPESTTGPKGAREHELEERRRNQKLLLEQQQLQERFDVDIYGARPATAPQRQAHVGSGAHCVISGPTTGLSKTDKACWRLWPKAPDTLTELRSQAAQQLGSPPKSPVGEAAVAAAAAASPEHKRSESMWSSLPEPAAWMRTSEHLRSEGIFTAQERAERAYYRAKTQRYTRQAAREAGIAGVAATTGVPASPAKVFARARELAYADIDNDKAPFTLNAFVKPQKRERVETRKLSQSEIAVKESFGRMGRSTRLALFENKGLQRGEEEEDMALATALVEARFTAKAAARAAARAASKARQAALDCGVAEGLLWDECDDH